MSLLGAMSNCGLETFVYDESKRFQYGIFANGIWQKRKEPIGNFTIQTHKLDGRSMGLTQDCAFEFEFTLPKIPITILRNIHKLYVDVSKKFKSEVYVSLYWDKIKEDYFIHVPKQEVSGAQVNFENEPEMLNNPDIVIVMDSHSHVNMSAFWSAQDIADQKASRLFSVLGKVDSPNPEILLTAGSNQQEKKLDVGDVFDFECEGLHEDSDYTISDDLILNIKERKYVAPAYKAPATKPYTYPSANKTVGTGYNYNSGYNSTKQQLINKIHSYQTSYSYDPLRIQELVDSFLDFLEEESAMKNLNYAQNTNLTDEIFDTISGMVDSALYNIKVDLSIGSFDEESQESQNHNLTDKSDLDDQDQSVPPNLYN